MEFSIKLLTLGVSTLFITLSLLDERGSGCDERRWRGKKTTKQKKWKWFLISILKTVRYSNCNTITTLVLALLKELLSFLKHDLWKMVWVDGYVSSWNESLINRIEPSRPTQNRFWHCYFLLKSRFCVLQSVTHWLHQQKETSSHFRVSKHPSHLSTRSFFPRCVPNFAHSQLNALFCNLKRISGRWMTSVKGIFVIKYKRSDPSAVNQAVVDTVT